MSLWPGCVRYAESADCRRSRCVEWWWGAQRFGVNLVSLMVTLREEGRLPIRVIQWYLQTVHRLKLSTGAIVEAIHAAARKAQPAVAAILQRIRGSPVVHADETGWREDGVNGYVLDLQHSHRAVLSSPGPRQGGGGRGAGRVPRSSRGAGSSMGCWSVTSTPHTTITLVSSSAAGRTCCVTSMSSRHCTLRTPP